MSSIFSRTNEYVQDVKRNTFDLSFQNNLTLQFGKLYPVIAQEVIPGDSYSIRPTFAFEFMPMQFPVQTRMRANLHFFYVRNRNLWKDFPDFIANTKEVDPPFLDMNGRYDNFLKVGQLGDYLGIPVSSYGRYGATTDFRDSFSCVGTNFMDIVSSGGDVPEGQIYVDSFDKLLQDLRSLRSGWMNSLNSNYNDLRGNGTNLYGFRGVVENLKYEDYSQGFKYRLELDSDGQAYFPNFIDNCLLLLRFSSTEDANKYEFTQYIYKGGRSGDGSSFDITLTEDGASATFEVFYDYNFAQRLYQSFPEGFVFTVGLILPNPDPIVQGTWSNPQNDRLGSNSGETFVSNINILSSGITYYDAPSSSLSPETSPYYDSVKNPKGLKISALPCRAIESIYNAFYRDIRNNPLIVDGQPEYNKYITNNEGGADTTPYELHYRNWEQDFLTTAVQSPQQGAAPLVGISSNGLFKFQDENGSVYTAQAKFAEDGETLTGFEVQSSDMPVGNLRSLVDLASSGISINDLRNVNSLQRWLENNMRKGLRLKDQIKAHFNVDIRYDELDMPEFIGGCSEDIRVNMVTQTSSDVEDSPLGSYAGQASCVGTSRNNITHYCDEHGYIIGILSITPVPNYSQLLPKHFIKRNVLDYFFPEFGHIGYQPIRYNEVCPVQTFNAGDSLDDTFGYQRAWYDYLARVDEVHGLFRTSLRNYLMNRVFDRKPDLSEQFLLVDPAQLNDVFATNVVDPDTGEVQDDKIFGQIYFDIKAKRPIPMFGIPRLE